MIVIDIGCKGYRDEDSIGYLIERYRPSALYGFDPHPQMKEGTEWIGATEVVTRRLAAWVEDGLAGWTQNGSGSRIDPQGTTTVVTFSLARFVESIGFVDVLKLDAEGAEYELIPDLLKRGIDARIGTLLVEWHGDPIDTTGRWNVEPWTL